MLFFGILPGRGYFGLVIAFEYMIFPELSAEVSHSQPFKKRAEVGGSKRNGKKGG